MIGDNFGVKIRRKGRREGIRGEEGVGIKKKEKKIRRGKKRRKRRRNRKN